MSRLFKGSKLATVPSLKDKCLEFAKNYPTCAHVVSLLIDFYEEEGTKESLALALEVHVPSLFPHLERVAHNTSRAART